MNLHEKFNINGFSIDSRTIGLFLTNDEGKRKKIVVGVYKYDGPSRIDEAVIENNKLKRYNYIKPLYKYTFEEKEGFENNEIYFKPKEPLAILFRKDHIDLMINDGNLLSNVSYLVDYHLMNGPTVKFKDSCEIISENIPDALKWDVTNYYFTDKFNFFKGGNSNEYIR